MKGIRVRPNAAGWLDDEAMRAPGAYGRVDPAHPHVRIDLRQGWWQVCTPDGHVGSLSPAIHTVTEHDDGTITVHPSIDMSKRHPGAYHGFLVRGEWS